MLRNYKLGTVKGRRVMCVAARTGESQKRVQGGGQWMVKRRSHGKLQKDAWVAARRTEVDLRFYVGSKKPWSEIDHQKCILSRQKPQTMVNFWPQIFCSPACILPLSASATPSLWPFSGPCLGSVPEPSDAPFSDTHRAPFELALATRLTPLGWTLLELLLRPFLNLLWTFSSARFKHWRMVESLGWHHLVRFTVLMHVLSWRLVECWLLFVLCVVMYCVCLCVRAALL